MKLAAVLAATVLLVAFSGLARAEDDPASPSKADRKAIATCVDEASNNGETAEKCIGIVSDPCLADPDNSSTPMMGACLEREETIWDDRLNDHYKKLMAGLDDERKASLKAQQKAWIAVRDATCEMEASFWDGGTGAGPASIGCMLRETGHRALTLYGFLGYIDQ